MRWSRPTGVVVGPLMRELIVYLDDPGLDPAPRRRAEGLLFDLLQPASTGVIQVPLPHDPRAREVAEALFDAPDDNRHLGAWGLEVGASIRTLARLFTAETGMTFGQWRTQVRMRAALGLLADDLPVATVARRVGYRTPSAFVAAFHRLTGRTPGAGPASTPAQTERGRDGHVGAFVRLPRQAHASWPVDDMRWPTARQPRR